MDLTINDSEITEAIADFVSKQGISLDNKDLKVSFTAGRGKDAKNSATIEISPLDSEIAQDTEIQEELEPDTTKDEKADTGTDEEQVEAGDKKDEDDNLFKS